MTCGIGENAEFMLAQPASLTGDTIRVTQGGPARTPICSWQLADATMGGIAPMPPATPLGATAWPYAVLVPT